MCKDKHIFQSPPNFSLHPLLIPISSFLSPKIMFYNIVLKIVNF